MFYDEGFQLAILTCFSNTEAQRRDIMKREATSGAEAESQRQTGGREKKRTGYGIRFSFFWVRNFGCHT
jgi:hypothetical protein